MHILQLAKNTNNTQMQAFCYLLKSKMTVQTQFEF